MVANGARVDGPAAANRRGSRSITIRRSAASSTRLRSAAIVIFLFYGAIHNAIINLQRAHIASGFGFWNNTAGFDISQTLIEYSSQRVDLWPRVLGRPAEHASGRGARHRARDRARLHGRHLPAVEELAAVAGRDRLCRTDPQHPAAAATAVLVQRRAQGAAGDARQRRAVGRQLPQQSRLVHAAADCRSPASVRSRSRCCSASSASIAFRYWAQRRQAATGQQAPVLWVTLALVIGLPLIVFVARRHSRWISLIPRRAASISAAAWKYCPNSPRCWSASWSIPRPSSPRWCAPASARSRMARPKRPLRSGCGPGRRCGSSSFRRRCA